MNKIISLMLVATLAGCATYRPIVDTKGMNPQAYESDLRECQAYAEQLNPAEHAAGGAVAGALFGAVLGAIVGNHDLAAQMAGVGAVSGAASGGGEGANAQKNIIRRCMSGRGYRVLN